MRYFDTFLPVHLIYRHTIKILNSNTIIFFICGAVWSKGGFFCKLREEDGENHMAFNQEELGKRIRQERIKNKLTIERLCELLDVSPSFIGLVERGTSGIILEKLCRLSEIFHVSIDYLIKGTEEAQTVRKETSSTLDALNTYLYNYSEEEISFVLDLLKFMKPRVELKTKKKG